jgi:antitoxin component of MazEF toxin-antitoxin module
MSAPRKLEADVRLTKQGNSTGVNLPRELLAAAGFGRGDTLHLTVDPDAGTITMRKGDDAYRRTMAAGRVVAARYRRTLAALAK